MRVEEQFFNDNFIAHQNDFELNNAGYYHATFSRVRDGLVTVYDEDNDGEFQKFECSYLNVLFQYWS